MNSTAKNKNRGSELSPVGELTMIQADPEKTRALVNQFDSNNIFHIQRFGTGAQKEISRFSGILLDAMQENQLDKIGSTIKETADKMEEVYPSEKTSFLKKLFSKKKYQQQLQNQFVTLEREVDQIARLLNQYKVLLLKDIALLEELYRKNELGLKELTNYIEAGEEILLLLKSSSASGDKTLMPSNETSLLQGQRKERAQLFSRRLNDLKTSRLLSLQMEPQIKIIQRNDQILLQRIGETLETTLPLWKNQMSLSLGLANTQKAVDAQKNISKQADQALKGNQKTVKKQQRTLEKTAKKDGGYRQAVAQSKMQLLETFEQIFKEQKDFEQSRKDVKDILLAIEIEEGKE